MSTSPADLIREDIQALSAYHVPDAVGLIKLDAMENPYAWPEALRNDWLATLRDAELHRYPDPQGRHLQAALRRAMGIPEGSALLLGNGSDELIQMLALAVSRPGRKVLSLDPGFVMYRMIALFAGLDYVGVPLQPETFALDLDATLSAIEREQPALTFIAYPNNPTGNLFDAGAIARIIEANPGLVIVDEAYAPFTDHSFLPRLGQWPNLLVMRTVSKMGLAGLRLGYLAGPTDWLTEIDKVRLPYNINVLTQASAAFALRHRAALDEQTAAIRTERATLFDALANLDGITPYPSDANFILVRTAPGRAGAIFQGLLERGVLIKMLDGAHPFLADCLRITVGTPDENAALLEALQAALATA
ncbi:MAG: histidinol-phosphate transaminase [Thiohalocapsa sp.]|jgi:histidinol-phosphate aminotransferase|uniref:histidinol-phosphate transaminase n=1 Tax=Thiohalocapsa sp. TaxID=2497641 RepID=UPI0025D84FA5|nr:histidinol-phosphate transaminase [Thiohalocapsa sp.]MCG6943419.1 histidinol-phosphate transaminase [Thiohalocapsa sp.]